MSGEQQELELLWEILQGKQKTGLRNLLYQ